MRRSLILLAASIFAVCAFLAVPVVLFELGHSRDFSQAIYILPDGNVAPSTSLIQRQGNAYRITENLSHTIVVKKSDAIINGDGYSINPLYPINYSSLILSSASNVTIQNVNLVAPHNGKGSSFTIRMEASSFNSIIRTNHYGGTVSLLCSHNNWISENTALIIRLKGSANNTISNNTISCLELEESYGNLVLRNNITSTSATSTALSLNNSSDNLVFGNYIGNHYHRWALLSGTSTGNLIVANEITGPFVLEPALLSEGNQLYNNNFINPAHSNEQTISDVTNIWDNNEEGNYWGDYSGTDANGDGIGDTPYLIDVNNQDRYPLMKPINIAFEPQPQLRNSQR